MLSGPWYLDKPNSQLTPDTDIIPSLCHGMTRTCWRRRRHLKEDGNLQSTVTASCSVALTPAQTPLLFVFLLHTVPTSSRGRNLSLHWPRPQRSRREQRRRERLHRIHIPATLQQTQLRYKVHEPCPLTTDSASTSHFKVSSTVRPPLPIHTSNISGLAPTVLPPSPSCPPRPPAPPCPCPCLRLHRRLGLGRPRRSRSRSRSRSCRSRPCLLLRLILLGTRRSTHVRINSGTTVRPMYLLQASVEMMATTRAPMLIKPTMSDGEPPPPEKNVPL